MNENRILEQFTAIFSIFMVLFYLAVGIYFVFLTNLNYIDKSLRVILGSTFIFYGIYRAFRTYVKIVEVFFTKDKEQD